MAKFVAGDCNASAVAASLELRAWVAVAVGGCFEIKVAKLAKLYP
jgi:hypothetical protein